MIADNAFDALLAEALASPERPVDRLFVAHTQALVAEAERFRRWRRRALRQLGSEALVLGAMAGAASTIARAPLPQAVVGQAPSLIPAAIGLALVMWAAAATRRGRAFG
jgi:hypothetical protein